MTSIKKFFKKNKSIPIDVFFEKILYDSKYGYYVKKNPIGKNGDFITAPLISPLFGEIIAIWIIIFWQNLNKPKNFNLIELGPGDGSLSKILLSVFKKFPDFYNSTNLYLYEKSKKLKKIQKQKLIGEQKIFWLSNFDKIKRGKIFFIGNEFFDAIPIKQFQIINGILYEKFVKINKNLSINFTLKKASKKNVTEINKYKTFTQHNFFEFPKYGLMELDKIIRKINKLNGGLLLIDYGYLKKLTKSSLQSVKNHKKNKLFKNLGEADVTSLVNFTFLKDYFKIKNLKVSKIVSQGIFLKKLGIIDRANIISKKMSFKEKSELYLSLKRILDPKYMGEIFKVIFVHNTKIKNLIGFD